MLALNCFNHIYTNKPSGLINTIVMTNKHYLLTAEDVAIETKIETFCEGKLPRAFYVAMLLIVEEA